MSEHRYGMRLRGFSPGCQPKAGLLRREDSTNSAWYDILVYDRRLTAKELDDFELDEIHAEPFGERLKALRKQLGMTQEALAKHYDMSKRNIQNWEVDHREPPEWAGELLLADMMKLLEKKNGAE